MSTSDESVNGPSDHHSGELEEHPQPEPHSPQATLRRSLAELRAVSVDHSVFFNPDVPAKTFDRSSHPKKPRQDQRKKPNTSKKTQRVPTSSREVGLAVSNLSRSEHDFILQQRDLRLQGEQLQQDYDVLQHAHTTLTAEHGESVKQQEDLYKAIETLTSEKATLQSEQQAQDTQLTALQDALDLAKEGTTSLQSTIAKQEQDLVERDEALQTATGNIAALESGHKRLQAENDTLVSEAHASKSELEGLRSQHDEVTTQVKELTATVERMEHEIGTLRNDNEALQTSLDIATRKASDNLVALEAAEKELEETNDTCNGLREEVQGCEATISDLRGERQGHIDTIAQEQNKTQCLLEENIQLRQDFQAAQDAIMLLNKHLRDPRLRITGSLLELDRIEHSFLEDAKPDIAAESAVQERPSSSCLTFKALLDRQRNFQDWFEIGDVTFDSDRAPDHGKGARSLAIWPRPAEMRVEALEHCGRHDQPLSRPSLEDIDGLVVEKSIRYRYLSKPPASQTTVLPNTAPVQNPAKDMVPKHQPEDTAVQNHMASTTGAKNHAAVEAPDSDTATQSTPDNDHKRPRLDSDSNFDECSHLRRRPICRRCLESRIRCSSLGQCEFCYRDDVRCMYDSCRSGLSCRRPRCPHLHPGQWDGLDQSRWGWWVQK